MGAMGDFESSDYFEWTYSSTADRCDGVLELVSTRPIAHTYTLEDGDSFTLNDSMLLAWRDARRTIWQRSIRSLSGTGAQLTVVLTVADGRR